MTKPQIDLKRYHSENANRYADLMSIAQDLREASLHFHAGELACNTPKPNYSTQLLAKAHWVAGATLYGRVFKGEGGSFERDNFVAKLRQELREAHNWLLNMHEKHISHSVNIFDEVIPTVGKVNGGVGVGYLGLRIINPRQAIMKQCYRLVRELLKLVEAEAGSAHRKFQNEAENLDDQFINSLPPAKGVYRQIHDR